MADKLDERGKEIVKNDIYERSLLPPRIIRKNIELKPELEDLEAFKRLKHIHDDCGRFVKEGWNLNLYSKDVGNGKTSWAIKIMKNFVETYACNWGNYDCLYISIPEFMALSKDFSFEAQAEFRERCNRIKSYSLVIFDELASKHSTEFDEQLLLRLVNHRIDNGKSTIYTSNVLPEELKKLIGERLADRIAGAERTVNIELKGGSRRNTTF